jgi:cell surface protein SprA
MIKLDQGEYSLMGDGYTGILTIDRPISDLQMIAIAYRQAGGSQFGEFVENVSPESLSVQNTPLILHLVKAKNSEAFGPLFPVAWNMLVKSIYPLGSTYIGRYGFSLQIVRRVAGMPDQAKILGHSLLNILGLDLYDQNGFPLVEGDGLFDFRPLRTIDPVRGEIIFPYLRPFDSGIEECFTSCGSPQPDSTYMLPEIYDRTVTEARAMLKSTYILQWREF